MTQKQTEEATMSLEQEVIDIVVEQLGVDAEDVTPEKSFVEDLNADSLDLTELIMTFEENKMIHNVDFTLKLPTGEMNEKLEITYNRK